VASTKAFSGQFVCLTLIALFFAQIKFESKQKNLLNLFLLILTFSIKKASFINPIFEYVINFLRMLPNILPGYLIQTKDYCKEIAKAIFHQQHIFCLGKGYGEAIAKEISLKIKEVSYIHAEGINALNFKHGPIAMIDPEQRTPVIMIVDKNDYFEEMKALFEIVKHKQPTMILITNAVNSLDLNGVDFVVEMPNQGFLSSFFAVFIGQMIGYYCCVMKGLNPDKPRNLSKEVTV
jgi:glucosamine--fructose-6-phosphate aminotransferase (isomerizing)